MRLKKYEIRMSVSKNLYDLISQEANNRDTKIAVIAREKLFIPQFDNSLKHPTINKNIKTIASSTLAL